MERDYETKPTLTLLGNQAGQFRTVVGGYEEGYADEQFLVKNKLRIDPNTTLSEYEFDGVFFKTIYNEQFGMPGGDDPRNQTPCNIGFFFEKHLPKDKKEKTLVEIADRFNLNLHPGRKTECISDQGIV